MRYFILIMLAFGMSVSACSKKKSTTTTTTTNTNTGYYIDNNNSNGTLYSGSVNVYDKATYKNFLYTGFGYQYYQTYNYNFSCNLDLFRWIFGGQLADCNSGQTSFTNLVNAPALLELKFFPKTTNQGQTSYPVDGLWVVDPNYSGYEIPFQGDAVELSDGRWLIEAGNIGLLTTKSGSTVNLNNFDVYYIWYDSSGYRNSTKFANVTIR